MMTFCQDEIFIEGKAKGKPEESMNICLVYISKGIKVYQTNQALIEGGLKKDQKNAK